MVMGSRPSRITENSSEGDADWGTLVLADGRLFLGLPPLTEESLAAVTTARAALMERFDSVWPDEQAECRRVLADLEAVLLLLALPPVAGEQRLS